MKALPTRPRYSDTGWGVTCTKPCSLRPAQHTVGLQGRSTQPRALSLRTAATNVGIHAGSGPECPKPGEAGQLQRIPRGEDGLCLGLARQPPSPALVWSQASRSLTLPPPPGSWFLVPSPTRVPVASVPVHLPGLPLEGFEQRSDPFYLHSTHTPTLAAVASWLLPGSVCLHPRAWLWPVTALGLGQPEGVLGPPDPLTIRCG